MHFDFANLDDEGCAAIAGWLTEWLDSADVDDVVEAAETLAELRL